MGRFVTVMGRPRKDSTEPSARERIISAFWELLGEMPYPEIKVSALLRRSGVSPNTLYRHFDGYDALVETALNEALDARLASAMVSGEAWASALAPDAAARFRRVALFASDGSGILPSILKRSLKELWMKEMGLRQESLDALTALELDFMFAGVVEMLGRIGRGDLHADQSVAQRFFERPLGTGILETMRSISSSSE